MGLTDFRICAENGISENPLSQTSTRESIAGATINESL
jgi:hypothetical protein